MQLQIPKNRITGVSFMMDPPLVKYNDEVKSYQEYELVDKSPYEREMVLSDIIGDNGEFN